MTVIANASLHMTISELKNINNKATDLGPLAKMFSLFSTTSREEKLMDALDLTDDEKNIHRKSLEVNKLLLYIEQSFHKILSLQSIQQIEGSIY